MLVRQWEVAWTIEFRNINQVIAVFLESCSNHCTMRTLVEIVQHSNTQPKPNPNTPGLRKGWQPPLPRQRSHAVQRFYAPRLPPPPLVCACCLTCLSMWSCRPDFVGSVMLMAGAVEERSLGETCCGSATAAAAEAGRPWPADNSGANMQCNGDQNAKTDLSICVDRCKHWEVHQNDE